MKRFKHSLRCSRLGPRVRQAALLGLGALALVVTAFAGSAPATFKGRPGLLTFHGFSNDGECGNDMIYLARPDLSKRRALTFGSQPSFSPDGKSLIFTRTCPNPATGEPAPPEIWRVNLDGSGLRPVIAGNPKTSSPSFSPNGKRIVYLRKSKAGNNDVWTARADGLGQRRLTFTPADEASPVWAPNGRYLVFTRRGHLWTIRPDGSRAHRLTRGVDADISPDGRSIVFARGKARGRGRDDVAELCVIRLGSRKIQVLAGTNTPGSLVGSPVFSPRGNELRYLRYRTGPALIRVWAVRTDGRGKRELPRNPLRPYPRSLDWQAR